MQAVMPDQPPALEGVRHEYPTVAGQRVHVALAGPDDGPPVLLVHGWPQNWWVWRKVIPALAREHRIIAPDLPGFGWSDAPAGAYEKEELASRLLTLLDELGVERTTWIGHDWGGWIGFLTALRAPERIERMLALAIPHFWAPPSVKQTVALLAYQVPISLPVLGPRVADPMARRILQVGRGAERLSAEDVDRFASHIPPHVTVAMYRTLLTREVASVRRGRYSRQTLEVPTTVLYGSRDAITRDIPAGPVAGQPQLHVEFLDGPAHWIPEQRPEAVIQWL